MSSKAIHTAHLKSIILTIVNDIHICSIKLIPITFFNPKADSSLEVKIRYLIGREFLRRRGNSLKKLYKL